MTDWTKVKWHSPPPKLHAVKLGEVIRATIRHANMALKEPDQEVLIKLGSDGWYFADEPGELNPNWCIVAFTKVK